MAYMQSAGPSTPGQSFGSFRRPSESLYQQQRGPSGSGRETSSPSSFGNESSGLARSSSFRSTPAAQSSFSFGGMREMSTPKSVRWEDAQSTLPPQQPSAATPVKQQPPLQYPYSLQYTGQYSGNPQQPQLPPQQQQQQQYQTNATQKFQPWSSISTMSQPQRTSPDSSVQRSFSSSLSIPGSNQGQMTTSMSTPSNANKPARSVFNNVVGSTHTLTKPTPIVKPPQPSSNAPIQRVAGDRDAEIASHPAIVARIKWNALALASCWLGPRFGAVGRLYWIALDVAYSLFGGDADVHTATLLSWLHKAVLLILVINIVEATILFNTTSKISDQSTSATTTETKRKPSLAHPPNRVVSASLPTSSSSSSSSSSASKRTAPRHYAHESPLRDSIFRASAIAQGLGECRRQPSQTPRFTSTFRQESNATPLAAFLARKQERLASGGDLRDMSWNGDADLSTDSIEVDRALRAFSAGYEREMSQSRTLDSEMQKNVITV